MMCRGTVGGNLCQHTRCWYFRNKTFECFKRGTGDCSAVRDGAENRYHAVFPSDRCASAHPSNLAPALVALGAKVAGSVSKTRSNGIPSSSSATTCTSCSAGKASIP